MNPFLRSIINKDKLSKEKEDYVKKFLIVGLGNIGTEYAETRHNIGFKILDTLAHEEAFSLETVKLGSLGSFKIKGRSVYCLKPSTYMNLSGKAIKYWLEKERIPLENLLVLTDDINLPFGTLRLKGIGSDGGHNGLKDTQQMLQTTNYNRLRFGIGSEFGKGRQIEYVLGEWDDDERKALPERLKKTSEIVRSFVLAGLQATMNQFNGT
jgi:PTH1 family peptidyl-tRNA hydrolase